MRVLLDAHLSPRLAEALARAGVDAVSVRDWRNGELLNAEDEELIVAAAREQRIFVTADYQSTAELLDHWAVTDRHHAGMIYALPRDRRREHIGSLTRRLVAVLTDLEDVNWTDRVVHLPSD